jgi:macrolide transport system ATP-binding/permease protein
MTSFFRKLIWLTRRRRKEAELREELEFHLEEEAEERQTEGLAAQEAQYAARRELGNITLLKENTRAMWTWTSLEQLVQDLRYGLRSMVNNRAFTALAALSLALGIGANTAIYSFMDFLLLRSLPVADPASLVVVNWHNKVRTRDTVLHSGSGTTYNDGKTGTTGGIFPFPAFELLHKSDAIFSSVFAYYPTRNVNLMVKGQAELAAGEYVSGDYFRGLAVPPAAGRVIIPDDDRVGAPAVAVLSFALSQKRFGDAASAPGQSILINNVPFTVAGVAPPGFFGVDPAAAPDFYLPLHANILLQQKGAPDDVAKRYLDQNYYWLEMMARLRPGASLTQAQAALGPVFHQWVASTASTDHERANLPELLFGEGARGLDTLRREYSKPLYVLLAMVGLILAIACANVANLLLARAAARRREMAVRLSMGAGRFRVVRQLLTESLLLASLGGALGVLFAVWGIRFLTLLLANGNERFSLHPDLNWHVLGAAVALSMLTGVLFGLAPALQSTRADVMPALKETRAGQSGPRRSSRRASLSQVLVVSQIAMSLLMLMAAGLFVRTLSNLQSIELGFNREDLLLFQMNARQAGHRDPEIVAFYNDLLKRFSAIPGVRSASVSQSPLLGQGSWMGGVVPVGKQRKETTHILMTGAGFFTTMQIPVLRGRATDDRDQPGSPAVAVVNEAYVKTNFGDQNPLGQHIVVERRAPFANREVEIVGVARNARYGALRGEFRDVVYVPFSQGSYYPVDDMTFALRTSGDPLHYVNTVREIVRQADTRIPVTNVKTQAAQVDQVMNREIIFARLCTGFAILALIIACVGLYGTMSYTVARRTGEIGIRMALGAQRGNVVWMVLRQVLLLAAVGLAISIPTALGTSKLVESFLFGVKPNDPSAMTLAVAILVIAALLAGYLPARKASRIDPMTALRHE